MCNRAAHLLGDLATFAEEHWGRRPLLRATGERFDDLLDVAGVERLLVDLGREPTFRLVRDGAQLPATTYTRRTRVGGTDVADVADVERILDLAAHGATIVLQGLHRSWPPLAEFCLDLEQVLGHAVQANAYLTPAGVAGLASHADTHEVIVLHVAGTKRWDVDGLGVIDLGPGDVLYMPAGTRHAAHTTRRFGLHITLGVLATTYRDVIARHVAGLAQPDLDRPLPLGYSSPTGALALADGLTDALAGAAEALRTTDPSALATAEGARRRRRARRRPLGRLRVALDDDVVHDDTVVHRGGGPFEVVDDESSVLLRAPDRALRMPRPFAAALAMLISGDETRVGDLPGLDQDDRRLLVRRLVREGVLYMEEDHMAPTDPTPTDSPATYPADRSMAEILDDLATRGYDAPVDIDEDSGTCTCGACGAVSPPGTMIVDEAQRIEGASDPADMSSVLALRCPQCDAGGSLVCRYGPEASAGEAALLRAVGDVTRS